MAESPPFESVITDAMRARIGVPLAPQTYEVTSTGVRMFAHAVGYEDSVFYDRDEAQRRGFRDLPAPPGFLGARVFVPAPKNQGNSGPYQDDARIESPYALILNGGTDVEYFGIEICSGDTLQGCTTLESLTERYSNALNAPMLFQTIATAFTNQEGQLVAILRGTGISYGPKRTDTAAGR